MFEQRLLAATGWSWADHGGRHRPADAVAHIRGPEYGDRRRGS